MVVTKGRRRGFRASLAGTVALALVLLVAPMSVPVGDSAVVAVWRINAGAGDHRDSAGRLWGSDRGFRGGGGIQHSTGIDIEGTADDALYQTNRWGMSGYDVPVGRPGRYVVRLLFAETVFPNPGARLFDVLAEGQVRIAGLDVRAQAGFAVAHDEVFDVDVADGVLNIDFGRISDDPVISAIEVSLVVEDGGQAAEVAAPPSTAPSSAPPTTAAPTTTTAPATTPQTTSPPAAAATAPAPAASRPAEWPGPSNTGVPAGTPLRPSAGFTVTEPGAVVEGLDVQGCIEVRANDVTIRNTRVRGSCWAGAIDTGYGAYSGVLIEDVEIDGGNENPGAALLGNSGFTCRRCNIHHGGSGIRMTSNVVIEDSWIHDLFGAGGSHNSAVGSNGGSNFVLRRNNIDCGTLPNCSGAFVLYGDFGPITDVLAEGNLFNGGGFCVYAGSVAGKPYALASNVRFLGNAFGRSAFPRCGYYGPVTAWGGPPEAWSGNHWVDNGEPV